MSATIAVSDEFIIPTPTAVIAAAIGLLTSDVGIPSASVQVNAERKTDSSYGPQSLG
jgi:hypothetical protein